MKKSKITIIATLLLVFCCSLFLMTGCQNENTYKNEEAIKKFTEIEEYYFKKSIDNDTILGKANMINSETDYKKVNIENKLYSIPNTRLDTMEFENYLDIFIATLSGEVAGSDRSETTVTYNNNVIPDLNYMQAMASKSLLHYIAKNKYLSSSSSNALNKIFTENDVNLIYDNKLLENSYIKDDPILWTKSMTYKFGNRASLDIRAKCKLRVDYNYKIIYSDNYEKNDYELTEINFYLDIKSYDDNFCIYDSYGESMTPYSAESKTIYCENTFSDFVALNFF